MWIWDVIHIVRGHQSLHMEHHTVTGAYVTHRAVIQETKVQILFTNVVTYIFIFFLSFFLFILKLLPWEEMEQNKKKKKQSISAHICTLK